MSKINKKNNIFQSKLIYQFTISFNCILIRKICYYSKKYFFVLLNVTTFCNAAIINFNVSLTTECPSSSLTDTRHIYTFRMLIKPKKTFFRFTFIKQPSSSYLLLRKYSNFFYIYTPSACLSLNKIFYV